MPYNGSGTFNRLYSWVTDAANGIKIRADRMDAEMNGFATGLTDCVTRDGQSPATANLPMGGFRHTNAGDATALASYATASQIVASALIYATVGGTANALTLNTPVAPSGLAAGQMVVFKATADVGAGGVTVNRNTLGAKAVQQFGAALGAGAWLNGDIVILEYDGAQYQLIWPLRTAGLLGSNNIWTGTQTIFSAVPELRFRETDQVLPAGLYRWAANGGNIQLQRNTAVAGDFSTSNSPIFIANTDVVTFLQPPVGSGASLTNLNASALSSGTIPNGVFPATLPAISGINLTALNASNLGSGTVPDARFPATLPAISGANLTALNASNIASGTIADARLSSNVPLLNAASNTFTGAQKISNTAPAQWFRETDQVLPGGLFCWTATGGQMVLKRNTAVAGDFSTSTNPLSFDAFDVATFLQPPVMSGASITSLNASNLSTGTVPDARFPATLPAISGANLTALNASNLGSGTVPDARFPATLPAISGANLTNLNASNLASGTVPAARLPNPAAGTLGGVKSLAAVAHKFLTSIGTDGLPVAAQPVVADLSDAGTSATVNTGTSGATLGLLNANKTDSGNNTYSGTSAFTGQATFSKQVNGPEAALVDGASISWDLSTAQAAHVTLGGNRTLANPTNMVAGGSYALKVTQDGTGSRTLAYGSAYKWAGGVAPVLSTAANAVDVLTFYSDGTNMYGAILKAFA